VSQQRHPGDEPDLLADLFGGDVEVAGYSQARVVGQVQQQGLEVGGTGVVGQRVWPGGRGPAVQIGVGEAQTSVAIEGNCSLGSVFDVAEHGAGGAVCGVDMEAKDGALLGMGCGVDGSDGGRQRVECF
jgi:hypothetical protein